MKYLAKRYRQQDFLLKRERFEQNNVFGIKLFFINSCLIITQFLILAKVRGKSAGPEKMDQTQQVGPLFACLNGDW